MEPLLLFIIILILIVSVIYVSRHWWSWVGQIPASDDYYKNYQETTTAGGEFTPRDISVDIQQLAIPKAEILAGSGEIAIDKIRANKLQLNAEIQEDSILKLGILNFPGWRVKLNGHEVETLANFKNQKGDYSGLIVVNLPQGNYKVQATFGETKLRYFADYLTLLSLILITGSTLITSHDWE